MQNVPKKKHAARRHSRILLLIFAVVLVAAAACLLIFARTPAPAPETPAHEDEETTLWAVESADITRIRIAVRNQAHWCWRAKTPSRWMQTLPPRSYPGLRT